MALAITSDTPRQINKVARAQLLQATARHEINAIADRLMQALDSEEALAGEHRYLDYGLGEHVYLLAAHAFIIAATTDDESARAAHITLAHERLEKATTFLVGNIPSDKRDRHVYTTMRTRLESLIPESPMSLQAAAKVFFDTTDAIRASYNAKRGDGRIEQNKT